jgi:hypothetical protein
LNNSIVTHNGNNGITLYGNGLVGNGLGANGDLDNRTYNTLVDGFGQLNALITNNQVTDNTKDGIHMQFLGRMGDDRFNFDHIFNGTPLTNNNIQIFQNNISNNGTFGIFVEQNAAKQGFTHFLVHEFANLDPNPPPANQSINPRDQQTNGVGVQNAVNSVGLIKDWSFLSNWMQLNTAESTIFNVLNNRIQGNGKNHDGVNLDAIKLRVGTETYLGANISNNILTGNVGNSLYTESFVQYNPVTKVSITSPFAAVHGTPATASSPGTPDIVYLDTTAQMYLNFQGNIGNAVNITNPLVNFATVLPGNVSGNGAMYKYDPQMDWPNPTTPPTGRPRLAQLFEVNDGNNLNTTNTFISNGVAQDLSNAFFQGDFNLRPSNSLLTPDPAFPRDVTTFFGDAFVP